MAIDGKLLVRAKTELVNKRRRHEEFYNNRKACAYAKNPRLRELDDEIKATIMGVVGAVLDTPGDCTVTVEELRVKNLRLQTQRRDELISAGFPSDYLDDEYMCKQCRDSGYEGIKICSCLMSLYKDELRKSLSSLLKLGDENFDNFKLSYYNDSPDPNTGISPRRHMEIIYETCVEYARKFGSKSVNLFLNGNPGLGKTFISACIARVVAENGYSVVYDTVSSVFRAFEESKFTRGEDAEALRAEVRRYLECDLLILDDLGTELTTAFTISALYELINTRLITGKKTIVSSNLTVPELSRRYSEQIASRLGGDYQVLTFCGEDIRRLKNKL